MNVNSGLSFRTQRQVRDSDTMVHHSTLINMWDDPRVQHRFAVLNGTKYHYLFAQPEGHVKATIFLVRKSEKKLQKCRSG